MIRPIYTPKGMAGEYADFAVNIYTGCTHGCTYCYAKDMHNRYRPGKPFEINVQPREGIIKALEKQLQTREFRDKLVHLCFTCDPYPAGVDTSATREAIKLVKDYGSRVQILTKCGEDPARDFDLLDERDWFGVTISGGVETSERTERNAGCVMRRQFYLQEAKERGINTWVSFEPVYDTEHIYHLIREADFIDLFRIGKLNHRESDIDWKEFGNKCEELCIRYGRKYEIKAGLRKEMEG